MLQSCCQRLEEEEAQRQHDEAERRQRTLEESLAPERIVTSLVAAVESGDAESMATVVMRLALEVDQAGARDSRST